MESVYLAPGMFGFGRIGTYDYFAHVMRGLERRFQQHGLSVSIHRVDVAPTASIRKRAGEFARLVGDTCGASGGIHLIGHSTGGLDARLVASPSSQLPGLHQRGSWAHRIRTVTTLNTPHFGTPLASFFATVSGQRALYALSALTFFALTLGSPPLALASALFSALGRLEQTMLGLDAFDRATEGLLKTLEPVRSDAMRAYLRSIKEDQGAVIQLSPEAMDLFQAGVEDRDGVTYQCVATMAPVPSAARIAKDILDGPWAIATGSLFSALYRLTARYDERYPCAAPFAGVENESVLVKAFGAAPGARANDGIVPIRSQLWGRLVWAGYADHLDVIGHFPDDVGMRDHQDWMRSGSRFNRSRFSEILDAITASMMASFR